MSERLGHRLGTHQRQHRATVRAARARWKIENAITVLTLKGDAFARGPAATSRLREGLEAAGAAVFDAPESGE